MLRVLETGHFNRVGGEEVLHSDARVISATNRSVKDLIAEGDFREDLYYRLNIIPIEVPPLRRRREDIPLLVEHFLEHFCKRHGREIKRVAPAAMKVLTDAAWPGNVRQLRNVIERMVITANGATIHEDELPPELSRRRSAEASPLTSLTEAVEACEKSAIEAALIACDMHRENTAKSLGVSVRTLHYKMDRYGLH